MQKTYLITGAAGFIGYHVAHTLLKQGHRVIGIDSMTDYYDVQLKHDRIDTLSHFEDWTFLLEAVEAPGRLRQHLAEYQPDVLIHLAAQAGIAYSSQYPERYMQANVHAFFEVLEALRAHPTPLLYASSSSVYGADGQSPFSEDQPCNQPKSLYAATKKANEMMAQSYSHLFGFQSIGLRFFTVYGPWGRPDMLLYRVAEGLMQDKPLTLYQDGQMLRSFTYVDDVVAVISALCERWPISEPHAVLNVGQSQDVSVNEMIGLVEKAWGKSLQRHVADMRPEEVMSTQASSERLMQWGLPVPKTLVDTGVPAFIRWYQAYHHI